jgi:hypothetical protein
MSTTLSYPRVIATMIREGFTSVITELAPLGPVHFVADADIDSDGGGLSHGDPDFQPDTALHRNGQPLNSDVDRYIVVPPVICQSVADIVLGAKAMVTNRRNGITCAAVVGDIGPKNKDGEISIALAKALNINPDPVRGGEDSAVIEYLIYPGTPAEVLGITYPLQPYRRES